jgi:DNA polymerase-4
VRVIFHLDMDAFFASVEEKMNPRLKGKPLVVGGELDRRGVVSSANYAARPYGIHAGMSVGEARRLCPHAVFVEGDPKKYLHLSLEILEILKDFTPAVEPFSIDEAFLDLTQVPPERTLRLRDTARGAARGTARGTRDHGAPRDAHAAAAALNRYVPVARAMQRAILKKTDLTSSIGVAPNKYIAKMASGLEKPSGLTVLTQERFREVFWPRGVQELWGIGEKTRDALGTLEIRTVGQLAHFPRELLTYHFGLNGERMQEAARGEDETPVTPYYEGIAVKSMGHEVTLPEDISDREALGAQLLRLSDQVARRLRQDGYVGKIVAVKYRDAAFKTSIRQHALPAVTNDEHVIFRVASELLDANWKGNPLRLVGVSVSGLIAAAGYYQHDLFSPEEHRRKLIEAVDSLRDRFGEHALVKAGVLF